MNWDGCEFVERVDGRCAGAPTVVGTRVFPDTIVDAYLHGMSVEEIRDDYPSVSTEKIQALIRFAERVRAKSAA